MASRDASFRDYRAEGANWITLATGEYYPDILPGACELYAPVQIMFGQLLKGSESSTAFFMAICEIKQVWMRIQLARVFRKYVCPSLSVEMLKKKSDAAAICRRFAQVFRPIPAVQKAFSSRSIPDEALCAVLWEYKDRGKTGYDLTERFFSLIRAQFPNLQIIGPERAGSDIRLGDIWNDYPKADRPVDFVIRNRRRILAIGFARYDSDRGGAQEDDRTGGYRDSAQEILNFTRRRGLNHVKLVFLNDGPGLLLGSMWNDYARLEELDRDRVRVVTLRMVPKRITRKWLEA